VLFNDDILVYSKSVEEPSPFGFVEVLRS
jgi:hypothetical protein